MNRNKCQDLSHKCNVPFVKKCLQDSAKDISKINDCVQDMQIYKDQLERKPDLTYADNDLIDALDKSINEYKAFQKFIKKVETKQYSSNDQLLQERSNVQFLTMARKNSWASYNATIKREEANKLLPKEEFPGITLGWFIFWIVIFVIAKGIYYDNQLDKWIKQGKEVVKDIKLTYQKYIKERNDKKDKHNKK